MDCFFCDILKGEKEKIVSENNNFFCIYDENPVSNGHALVIPKNHIESFFDLSGTEIKDMYDLMKEVKEIIAVKYKPDAYNIGVNDGQAAGRTIHHLHVHIMPRYTGDVENPRGGVRTIFPGKGDYHKALLDQFPERKKYLKE